MNNNGNESETFPALGTPPDANANADANNGYDSDASTVVYNNDGDHL